MNRPLWAAIIVIVLIGGGIVAFNSPFTELPFGVNEFSHGLRQLRREGSQRNWEEVQSTIEDMEDNLDRASLLIQMISGTDGFNDVQRMLHRLRGSANAQDEDAFRQNLAEILQVWMRAVSL